MNVAHNTLYNHYGAHALKARYQANLITSQLLVLGLVAVALVTSALWPTERLVSIPVEPRRPDSVVATIRPQPTIKRTEPKRGTSKPPSDTRSNIIPEMVSDDETGNTSVISTDDVQGNGLNDSVGFGEGAFDSIEAAGFESIPGPTDIRFCEIIPEIVKTVTPDYPEMARKMGLEGRVAIRALVDTLGDVRDVQLAKSSGVEILDSAAVKAAWKCRYSPGIQNGRPVWVWVTYPVVFRLDR